MYQQWKWLFLVFAERTEYLSTHAKQCRPKVATGMTTTIKSIFLHPHFVYLHVLIVHAELHNRSNRLRIQWNGFWGKSRSDTVSEPKVEWCSSAWWSTFAWVGDTAHWQLNSWRKKCLHAFSPNYPESRKWKLDFHLRECLWWKRLHDLLCMCMAVLCMAGTRRFCGKPGLCPIHVPHCPQYISQHHLLAYKAKEICGVCMVFTHPKHLYSPAR